MLVWTIRLYNNYKYFILGHESSFIHWFEIKQTINRQHRCTETLSQRHLAQSLQLAAY